MGAESERKMLNDPFPRLEEKGVRETFGSIGSPAGSQSQRSMRQHFRLLDMVRVQQDKRQQP